MLRTLIALWCGKFVLFLTKILQQGGGTAAPGLVALKIDSQLIERASKQLSKGSVVITGTNGKTTTSRLISHYFSQNHIRYIHNRAGSNLERGIASTYIAQANWLGKVTADIGLWELDEAAFSKIIHKLNPTHILLLNLFRDQLDRYGEVDATKNKWVKVLSELSRPTTIIYNADDPQLVYLQEAVIKTNPNHTFIPFSIQPSGENDSENDILSPVELVLCPRCRQRLIMQQTIAGLGKFNCPNCLLKNPRSEFEISNFQFERNTIEGQLHTPNFKLPFKFPLPGTFNLYNFLAASTYLESSGQSSKNLITVIKDYKPAFARMELLTYDNTQYILTLIKNPTGFTESLKTIFNNRSQYAEAIFILNDNFADGKDVSWIWDVTIAKYIPEDATIIVSGSRCYDMAIRIKYGGFTPSKIITCENLHEIFTNVKSAIVPIFATYTASLELQNYFEKNGVKNKYWKE